MLGSHGYDTLHTNDLSDTRHKQVAAFGEDVPGVLTVLLRHLLHVERLQLRGEAVQEHRHAKDVGHPAFSSLSDVIADGVVDHLGVTLLVLDDVAISVLSFVLDAVLVEPLYRVDVRHTQEGSRGGSEIGVELLDERSGGGVSQQAVDSLADLAWKVTKIYCV